MWLRNSGTEEKSFSVGATRMKNDDIRGMEHVGCLAYEAREARLSQYVWKDVGNGPGRQAGGSEENQRSDLWMY